MFELFSLSAQLTFEIESPIVLLRDKQSRHPKELGGILFLVATNGSCLPSNIPTTGKDFHLKESCPLKAVLAADLLFLHSNVWTTIYIHPPNKSDEEDKTTANTLSENEKQALLYARMYLTFNLKHDANILYYNIHKYEQIKCLNNYVYNLT